MDILFLGTGSAWRLPEHSCRCMICTRMLELNEERTRTSIEITTSQKILIDPGPDLITHMKRYNLETPDLILITHEHGDHYIGIDDLLAFKRSGLREAWKLIRVYATETTWRTIDGRFSYLAGSLFAKRIIEPGKQIWCGKTSITPFKTFHGPTAEGSVGYVIEEIREGRDPVKLVYTSDFMSVEIEPESINNPDVLIIQSHWLNEPVENRPCHMSLQRALDFIKKWNPRKQIFLVHISGGDQVPGDFYNDSVKKAPALNPMTDPKSGKPYPVPLCQEDWNKLVAKISEDNSLSCLMTVPKDGDSFSI